MSLESTVYRRAAQPETRIVIGIVIRSLIPPITYGHRDNPDQYSARRPRHSRGSLESLNETTALGSARLVGGTAAAARHEPRSIMVTLVLPYES